jgi:hypothetical protein
VHLNHHRRQAREGRPARAAVGLVLGLALLGALEGAGVAGGLDPLLDGAKREGLPVGVLLGKVREGRAKKIPEARIAQVVGQLVGFMREARARLAKEPGAKTVAAVPGELLASIAGARLGGVPEALVWGVLRASARPERTRRVDALSDVFLRGYADREVVELVTAVRLEELVGLGRVVDETRRDTGLTQAEVIDALARALKEAHGSVQTAASQVAVKANHGKSGASPASKVKKVKNDKSSK